VTIQFFAHGEPKGQPRPKAFARKFGAKWSARVYDPGTAEGWKSQIAVAAHDHIPHTPIAGPLALTLEFIMPRPKSHYRTGKNAGQLRDDAPAWHTGKPDRDNLEKAVMDALTQLGFWVDDSQVCDGPTTKRYAKPGERTGVEIWIMPAAERVVDNYERQVALAIGGGQ